MIAEENPFAHEWTESRAVPGRLFHNRGTCPACRWEGALRPQEITDPDVAAGRGYHPAGRARPPERVEAPRSAVRGIVFASAMSAPFWLALVAVIWWRLR